MKKLLGIVVPLALLITMNITHQKSTQKIKRLPTQKDLICEQLSIKCEDLIMKKLLGIVVPLAFLITMHITHQKSTQKRLIYLDLM